MSNETIHYKYKIKDTEVKLLGTSEKLKSTK